MKIISDAFNFLIDYIEAKDRVRRPRIHAASQQDHYKLTIHLAHSHLPGNGHRVSELWTYSPGGFAGYRGGLAH